MKKSKPWIADAIEHPGALTRKAKKAGQSTAEYAQEHKGDKGRTGKQARLAITLGKLKSHMPTGGKMRGTWGDVGALRQKEAVLVGGFKDGKIQTCK